MLISLDRYRRKRWRFSWRDLPAARVLQLPALPRLVPIHNQITDVTIMDDVERATLAYIQSHFVPGLGFRIELAYRALVLLVGEHEADIQVQQIIQDYLQEEAA